MANEQFDLIVIGAGPGGYVASIRAAQLGFKVACVEKEKTLGGTCLNVGCIPSKALLESSEHYLQAKTKFQKHGIVVGEVKLDLETMMKRKEGVVRQLTNGVQYLFKKNGVEWAKGHGRFAGIEGDQKIVEVEAQDGSKRTLQAPRVLIATGSTPVELPFLKFDGKKVLSSTEALSLPEVPKHLVIIGGGVIGLEMGSVWSRLGAKVTIVEYQDRVANGFDLGVAVELQKILTKQGIEFRLNSKCLGAANTGAVILVEVESRSDGTKSMLEADYVLVSTGRRPYTGGLNLEKVGLETNKQGQVEIDSHFQTKVPGIYAIGDVVRGAMLAHKAEEEGIAAVEIMKNQAGHVFYEAIPGVVYTHPELASVGYTEEQLKEKGIPYKAGSFSFMPNGRAKAMEDTEGFVKVLGHAETGALLGMHIVGPRAGDLIHEGVLVLEYGGTVEDLARSSHAHPSLPEVIKEAAMVAAGHPLHM